MIDPLYVADDYGFDPNEELDNVKAADCTPPRCPVSIHKWILFTQAIAPIDAFLKKRYMKDYYFHALQTLHNIALDEN